MDFVTHLPRTSQGHDAVWVIVDRLTKSAQFLAMQMTFTLEEFSFVPRYGDRNQQKFVSYVPPTALVIRDTIG